MDMEHAKVTILGAGATGGTMAQRLAELGCVHTVVLYDILEDFPQGKALDLAQSGAILGFDTEVIGTNDLNDTVGSSIIINTAGASRKPGQTREDLARATAPIVRALAAKTFELSPDAVYLGFTNPMDAMTQVAMEAGWQRQRIVGQGGILDSARFRYFMAQELRISARRVKAYVLGGHTDDTMVPITSNAKVDGVPLTSFLPKDRIAAIVQRTKKGGTEIVNLMKTGGAFYAPAAAVAEMVESILNDRKKLLPCSVYLEGEYGISGAFTGVPVRLGRNGVEKIVQWRITPAERDAMQEAARATRALVART